MRGVLVTWFATSSCDAHRKGRGVAYQKKHCQYSKHKIGRFWYELFGFASTSIPVVCTCSQHSPPGKDNLRLRVHSSFAPILMSLRLCIRLRVGVSRVVLVFIGYLWSLVPWTERAQDHISKLAVTYTSSWRLHQRWWRKGRWDLRRRKEPWAPLNFQLVVEPLNSQSATYTSCRETSWVGIQASWQWVVCLLSRELLFNRFGKLTFAVRMLRSLKESFELTQCLALGLALFRLALADNRLRFVTVVSTNKHWRAFTNCSTMSSYSLQ